MTLAADCGWALLRSAGVAAAAVLVAALVRARVASAPRRLERVLWAVHVAPLLTPVVLVGYGWSRLSL